MPLLGGAITAAGASYAQQTTTSAVGYLPHLAGRTNPSADQLNRFGNSTNRWRHPPWPETASTKRKGWPLPEPGIRAAADLFHLHGVRVL
jgi:hypothetical protein